MSKMDKTEEADKALQPEDVAIEAGMSTPLNKTRNRGRKRKRHDSESSSDHEDILPENLLEVEKNLQASAMKNNLDDASVKKILKKVVTNDHVLALVKLREEEEDSSAEERNLQPKLTRATAKKLMGMSPKSAPWNLELTPIKHIPVKTRPEVKALIAQELPEDEDDDEYEPHEDVPSDDDQTLESCSDLDSQPRTPATPKSVTASPQVVKDGPFKVPQPKTPARRKLNIEEGEATIALRTRSRINLSATTIEHIESSFIPPDELPTPVDEIWNQFLEECMNPEELRNEEDDDADPEYNVAADPDAHDEDEEALEGSLVKISKKELSDLVTELFSILPEATSEVASEVTLADNLATTVLTDTSGNEISSRWEGKQEPMSDEDTEKTTESKAPENISQRKRDSTIRFSIGKSEPEDPDLIDTSVVEVPVSVSNVVSLTVEERHLSVQPGTSQEQPPPLLRSMSVAATDESHVEVSIDDSVTVLPAQLLILQQQLRQHVQLAASNYLQLYVNPAHWNFAPAYKRYLEQLEKMVQDNPRSVVDVCNLKPACNLIRSWEQSVSEDTPENKEMVEFIQKETERGRKRYKQNALYVGDFPKLFQDVVANSTVFLYPYLLPAMPYRGDNNRKFGYRRCEDELIATGLDQFWKYIEDNPELFKRSKAAEHRSRWGLVAACNLICKHMFPWMLPKGLQSHIHRARKYKDNPIATFFNQHRITAVQHKLLPFNPALTLYEQPAHEMPRIWVRFLSKTSRTFRDYYYRRRDSGRQPEGGVPITMKDTAKAEPSKAPLPSDFTQTIVCKRINSRMVTHDIMDPEVLRDKLTDDEMEEQMIPAVKFVAVDDVADTGQDKANLNAMLKLSAGVLTIGPIISHKSDEPKVDIPNRTLESAETNKTTQSDTSQTDMFKVVQTSVGAYLVPLKDETTTVNSVTYPISSATANCVVGNNLPEGSRNSTVNHFSDNVEEEKEHCKCCEFIKKICKEKQTVITDFFKPKRNIDKRCDCNRRYPRVTRRLKMLVNNYKNRSWCERRNLESMILALREEGVREKAKLPCKTETGDEECSLEDIEFVMAYQMKLTVRSTLIRDVYVKRAVNRLFTLFDPEFENPLWLADKLWHIFKVDLVDLYKEFMGFLTAEQADRIGRFQEYFVENCIGGLIKKVEAEVQDKDKKHEILSYLHNVFSDNVSTSCDSCVAILSTMTDKPRLAKYVFSLFPHKASSGNRDRSNKIYKSPLKNITSQSSQATEQNAINNAAIEMRAQSNQNTEAENIEVGTEQAEGHLTICVETAVDYEADNSASDDENSDNQSNSQQMTTATEAPYHFNTEVSATKNEVDTSELTITKTEIQDLSASPSTSPLVMSEDELVKTEVVDAPEASEWKRDEDKLILEILLQHVTRLERKEMTILETLDEKNVYQMIATSLPHKSIDDVKERVIYLLEILVLSEY